MEISWRNRNYYGDPNSRLECLSESDSSSIILQFVGRVTPHERRALYQRVNGTWGSSDIACAIHSIPRQFHHRSTVQTSWNRQSILKRMQLSLHSSGAMFLRCRGAPAATVALARRRSSTYHPSDFNFQGSGFSSSINTKEPIVGPLGGAAAGDVKVTPR